MDTLYTVFFVFLMDLSISEKQMIKINISLSVD